MLKYEKKIYDYDTEEDQYVTDFINQRIEEGYVLVHYAATCAYGKNIHYFIFFYDQTRGSSRPTSQINAQDLHGSTGS